MQTRKNNGNSYSGNWMFLFGWGTGDNPMNASENNDDYSTFVDWGINAISNGGNQTGIWRTLSSEEWLYLFNGRLNANDKYGTGNVNGIGGLIILPDNWICPTGLTFNSGFSMDDTDWSHNTYTFAQWQQMEDAGAVLLPSILGGWVHDVGFGGGGYHRLVNVYWSFAGINESATYLFFNGMDLSPQNYDFNEHRNYRLAVRLVHDAD